MARLGQDFDEEGVKIDDFDPWEHFYDDDYDEEKHGSFKKMKPKIKKVKKDGFGDNKKKNKRS